MNHEELGQMDRRDWWVFLFCSGTILFNWPVLETARAFLPYYLYGLWACFIGVIALRLMRGGKKD